MSLSFWIRDYCFCRLLRFDAIHSGPIRALLISMVIFGFGMEAS